MPGPVRLEQADFSAGMFRWPRERIPPNGVYDAIDGILTDDGSLVERGGTRDDGNSEADTTFPIFSQWSGYLPLTQTQATLYLYLNGGNDVLMRASPGGAYQQLIAAATLTLPSMDAARGALVGGALLPTADFVWGGQFTSPVAPGGTVTVTNGSTTVVGAGTTFTSLTNPTGLLFWVGSNFDWGLIKGVTDNTHLELVAPWRGATSGASGYTIARHRKFTSLWPMPPITSTASATYAAAVGSPARLVLLRGQYLTFSEPGEPWFYIGGGGAPVGPTVPLESFHEFPDGNWGTGVEALGDTALCFLSRGVWAVDNLNLDQTDPLGNPQHRVRRVSDLALWGNAGLIGFKSAAVIAPCLDDIYVIDSRSEPRNISRPITALYRSYVAAGYRPGGAAIWRNHYILPIISAPAGTIVDTLVCRIDTGAWTHWTTRGLSYGTMYDVGSAVHQAELFGGERTQWARATSCLTPGAGFKNDLLAGSRPAFSMTTRDIELGSNHSHNQVKQVRVTYELADASADNPKLLAYLATDAPTSTFTQLMTPDPDASESDGGTPYTWTANVAGRVARLKLSKGPQPSAGLTVRKIELFCRPGGKAV